MRMVQRTEIRFRGSLSIKVFSNDEIVTLDARSKGGRIFACDIAEDVIPSFVANMNSSVLDGDDRFVNDTNGDPLLTSRTLKGDLRIKHDKGYIILKRYESRDLGKTLTGLV